MHVKDGVVFSIWRSNSGAGGEVQYCHQTTLAYSKKEPQSWGHWHSFMNRTYGNKLCAWLFSRSNIVLFFFVVIEKISNW